MKNISILLLLSFSLFACQQNSKQSDPVNPEPPAPGLQNPTKERDETLIGLWKGTEILGSGEFTMTNETYLEFLEDGTVLTWPGRSVGPDYSRDEDKSQTSKSTWYTNGKSLHMADPATGQDAETYYSVNESGLLMSNGSQKKAFERIR